MTLTTLAHGIGKGLVAGFAGTVAMTISSTIEQKTRGRESSSAPAKVTERALGIQGFKSPQLERRFSTLVHWGVGSGWGIARGVMRAAGIPPGAATAGHFSAVWGSALVTLPMFDVGPPVTMWDRKDIAIDVWHHLVYVTATAIAYEALDRA